MKMFKFYSLYALLGPSILTIALLVASLKLDESHPFYVHFEGNVCFVGQIDIQRSGKKLICKFSKHL